MLRESFKTDFLAVAGAVLLVLSATAQAATQFPVDDITKVEDQYLEGASGMALFKSMLMDEQLEATEKAVAEFRTKKTKTALGDWKLSHFYDGLKGELKDPRLQPMLDRWDKRFPNSPTPKLIKAHFLFLDVIGNTGQEGFNQKDPQETNIQARKLKTLSAYLDEIKASVAPLDPHWYVLRARADLLGGTEPIAFLGNVLTGLKQEPTYQALQDAATDYYVGDSINLERWARLLQQATANAPGTGGAYALAYWRAYNEAYRTDMRRRSAIDWDDFKKSAAALAHDYPDPQNIGRMALMTCVGADREGTRNLIAMGKEPLSFYPWASLKRQKACAAWAEAPSWVRAYEWLMKWVNPDQARLAEYGPTAFVR